MNTIKRFKLGKFFVLFVIFLVTLFAGCGAEGSYDKESSDPLDSGDNISESVKDDRKVYFTVDYSFETTNVQESVNKLNQLKNKYEGYTENSTMRTNDYGSYATYVVKIPTEKLDAFMDELESNNGKNLQSKNIESTDVTTSYISIEAQIETLTASRAQYQKMLEEANLDMNRVMQLNDKINEIDYKLNALNLQKTKYDNLIEYSTVTVRFNDKTEKKAERESVFKGYGDYLIGFGRAILYVVLYTLPFGVIAGAVLFIIFFAKKKNKKKNNVDENNKQ